MLLCKDFTLVQTSHIAERNFSCRMEGVLARLLLPDSAQIAAATADLRTAFKQVRILFKKRENWLVCIKLFHCSLVQ